MILRRPLSRYPAKSIADLQLDDKIYSADLAISDRFQALSKELVRISVLGLGVYGFLIKEVHAGSILPTHPYIVISGLASFAVCASGALLHSFFSNQCLGYQLVISRYFGRLEGDRWDDGMKEKFREEIKLQQRSQRSMLIVGNYCLLVATVALIFGAVLVAICACIAIWQMPPHT